MQNEIDVLVDKFIDIVKEVAQYKQVKSIKQYHRDRSKGYKTISCVIEHESYRLRFAYHINEGAVFKKGIITMYFNIGSMEYHFSDILAHVAPRDKDLIVFPYVDNVDTMRYCIELLWEKVVKYQDKIVEMVNSEELKSKLELTLKNEIKIFSGKDLPKDGPLALMLSGIYANTSLIRYTSEPYECFVNGKYEKAIKQYNKESNLALYEQQLVKFMKRAIKAKKKVEIPEEQKTLNHVKEVKKSSRIYTFLSFIMLLPTMLAVCVVLSKLFTYAITQNTLLVLSRSKLFLVIPTMVLSIVFTKNIRNWLFKKKLDKTFQFEVLYNTDKHRKFELNIMNSVVIASIITVALLAASSISFREDGIKYSKDILDFKGTIVPYNEIQKLDTEKKVIVLENGEEIFLDTFNYTLNDLKLIKKLLD